MKIKAEIIADSKNIQSDRIPTFVLTFPRFILAELNTHRMFSKNSASSRAIPFEKMVKSVQENPFVPIAWGKKHSGMQGTEYFTDEKNISWFKMNHLKARDQAVERATDAHEKSLTKQLCNRLLEPFMWHTVILTATEFSNFFELRCPKYYYDLEDKYFKSKKEWLKYYKLHCIGDVNSDFNLTDLEWLSINKGQSEIHMMALAEAMYDALNESVPKLLKAGEYHIPFKDKIKEQIKTQLYKVNTHLSPNGNYIIDYSESDLLKISTVMCARVSYTTVGEDNKEFNYENDIKLYDKLLASNHLSPFEHCAKAMSEDEHKVYAKIYPIDLETNDIKVVSRGWCNNFRGFIQYRYLIENKNE